MKNVISFDLYNKCFFPKIKILWDVSLSYKHCSLFYMSDNQKEYIQIKHPLN